MSDGAESAPAGAERAVRAADRPHGWLDNLVFAVFRVVVIGVLKVVFRLQVENRPRLEGGYVVVANHTSFLDPILIGAASTRRIAFLMTMLHFRSPWFGWFYRWNRAIPLALRGGNRQALRVARNELERGGVVGIFPEGGLSRDGGLLLGNPGAVSLVANTDVPVVPCWIEGAGRALPLEGGVRPGKIVVRFGAPIPHADLVGGDEAGLDRRGRLKVATRTIMDRIAALGGVESREAELERHGRTVDVA